MSTASAYNVVRHSTAVASEAEKPQRVVSERVACATRRLLQASFTERASPSGLGSETRTRHVSSSPAFTHAAPTDACGAEKPLLSTDEVTFDLATDIML